MDDIRNLKKNPIDRKMKISAIGQRLPAMFFFLLWISLTAFMAYLCYMKYYNVFLILSFIFGGFAIISILAALKLKKIYSDQNYLYIKHKKSNEIVQIESIYAISRPYIRLSPTIEPIKIFYRSANGVKKTVRFIPAVKHQIYNRFIDSISEKNIAVKIKRNLI